MMGIHLKRISTRVGIVDIGIANIGSLHRSLIDIVESVTLIRTPNDLATIDRLILPGVGSFPEAMKRLRDCNLGTAIDAFVGTKKPLLGICLGMQLLATVGEELQETHGLGLIDGRVQKLAKSELVRIPHMGWNSVQFSRPTPLLEGIPNNHDFYYVHSFVFVPREQDTVTAVTRYGEQFCSIVQKDNVFGVQFHPEKSSLMGQRLLANFCNIS